MTKRKKSLKRERTKKRSQNQDSPKLQSPRATDRSGTRRLLSKHTVPIIAAVIGVVGLILVELLKTFVPSSTPTVPLQTIGEVSNFGEGVQIIGSEGFEIKYETYGVTRGQFDQLVQELQVSREMAKRLLKVLKEKDVELYERESKFKQLLVMYAELKNKVNAREDDVSQEVVKLLERGELEEAEQLLTESLQRRLSRIGEDRVSAASDAFELGRLKLLQLDIYAAFDFARQAVELDPSNIEYLTGLGTIEIELENYESSTEHLSNALSLTIEKYGENSPETADVYSRLGIAAVMGDMHHEAVSYFTRTIEIVVKVYGEDSYIADQMRNSLAGALAGVGEIERANELAESSIKKLLENRNNPHYALALNNFAIFKRNIGELQEAIAAFTQAEEAYWKENDRPGPFLANILSSKGEIMIAVGNLDEAIPILERANKIYTEIYSPSSTNVISSIQNLGMAWHAAKNYSKAIGYYHEALDLCRDKYGENHRYTMTFLNLIERAENELPLRVYFEDFDRGLRVEELK